ncbi:MAG: NADH-quinone oxidoreductase subunit NuoH [Thermodesulfobacteriota bacterium]
MLVYERKKVEYHGRLGRIVALGTALGRFAGPLLLRMAPLIFLAATVGVILFSWIVAHFVNPIVPWLIRDIIAITGIILFVSLVSMIGIWGERKISGRLQSRLGPMRTGGWHGWAQSLADGLKFVQKEDLIPRSADRLMFRLAPYIALVPAIAAYAAIPFGVGWVYRGMDASLLFVLAMLGIEVLGVILAGWASNNKWGLYGAMREACQLVSYEIPMCMSLLVPVMTVGSIDLLELGKAQSGGWFDWLIFRNPFIFLSFFSYYIASLASCKRAPFDLPEGESELVAGFHTEYSGFRFTIFFFAEYAAMFIVSALATIIFLGGWNSPFGDLTGGPLWFTAKSGMLIFIQMWVRWTLPRIRIDQVMHACVKYLLPFTMLLFVGSSLWQLFISQTYVAFALFLRYVLGAFALGILGIVMVAFYVVWAVFGYMNSPLMVGRLVRKHLPGA